MNIRLIELELTCRKSVEVIPFTDFNYFYGEIGAGKSTIARLIDYCFGGDIVMTPALQSEFVEASLRLTINGTPCLLSRERDSNQVTATWGPDDAQEQLMLPARRANGVVIPDTEVENLSDFIFHLAGLRPPKVRRSRQKEDSELSRLSFRDLYDYCYLDQNDIDSSFFHLDREADFARRLKSQSVLRYVLGYNQERVAELQAELEEFRERRLQAESASELLIKTLAEAGIGSEVEIQARLNSLTDQEAALKRQIEEARKGISAYQKHASDILRNRAQQFAGELEAIEDAGTQIGKVLAEDQRHLNEILSLSTKVQRVTGARALLNGVAFDRCPRCTQTLPLREVAHCPVCDQQEPLPEEISAELEATRKDFEARVKELRGIIARQQEQLKNLEGRRKQLVEQKGAVDAELSRVFLNYDPASIANIIQLEGDLKANAESVKYLRQLAMFLERAATLRKQAEKDAAKESEVRSNLKNAREEAEKDTANIKKLTALFADCLIKAKLPGFSENDAVEMRPPYYLPEVIGVSGDIATISFATLGSGGIKTLFKACFAVALHRLAVAIQANLPSLLVIDSPMKNISERENKPQWQGFHEMIYGLAAGELRDTQFVLIDKEFCPPSNEVELSLFSRHMMIVSDEFPPLIRYFRAVQAITESRTNSESSENPAL
jgi:hypothetical protein